MFREFYSNKECNELVDFSSESQENLKSPEWNSIDQDGNTITNYYVSHRISKRQNIEEGDHNMTSTSSKRISQSTQWVVNQRPGVSSEQYHLINYGIGGTIEVHVDYWGKKRHQHPGGARMVTFLGYMSDVESGGRTIFPAIGLTIKPVKGDALFWLTTKD